MDKLYYSFDTRLIREVQEKKITYKDFNNRVMLLFLSWNIINSTILGLILIIIYYGITRLGKHN